MKKRNSSNPIAKRLGALLLVLVMLLGILPTAVFAASGSGESALISTKADPETLTRPDDIYGNDTEHAGKVTVGKSVSTGSVTVPLEGGTTTLNATDPNSFMVTVSQSAQVVGVIGQSSVPVDVVFVLDTSGSMDDNNRAENMVTAANGLIKNLMESNEQNRVGVVAFSGSNGNNLATTTTVLSALDHYEDESGSNINNRQAASQHITWGSNSALRGRNANNTVNTSSTRNGKNGGTNIQAGIARGAQMLTGATNITVAVDTNADGTSDTEMVRMPILVILSDGAPTYSADNAQWWNPNGSTQGAGNDSNVYAGEGFLAMLTAAYYKKAIAEHYYGANTEQEATIYTIGVSLGSITKRNNNYEANDKTALANLTMNPSQWLGVSINSTSIDDNIKSYWNKYIGRESFNIAVGIKDRNSDGSYSFTASGTNANILASVTDLKYNDKYWATGDSDIATAFDELSTEISKKAMSVPTMVTTTENFSGYVTFTDVLGEYMELKNMTGVVANGKVYQGISFAKHFSDYGEAGAAYNSPEFDAQLREVMQTRLNMSDSMKNDADFVEENIRLAKASEKQAYYRSDTDYDNSLVWWGTTYDVGEEDTNIQNLGYADDDSIAYIEEERAAGRIPTGADCVVRSYFFYGTAGETDQDPHHEYLYFVVRVSRSLTAPYQQTVVISAPASLLSMERVLIHEESNGTYTAEVEEQLPVRVVYEVGLRGDINPYNVDQVVSESYKTERVNGVGTANYADGVYNFFTNDWNRGEALDEHHRAMAKATFDAAADNGFYCYQGNETLYVKNGSTYTKYTGATLPNGVYYYAREGYSWSGAPVNGKYTARAETFYIKVDIEDDNKASIVKAADNSWYIPAGLYTASTLQVNGDDVLKDVVGTPESDDGNLTGTAAVVAHPHRTGNVNNSHYTVLLGNNGVLTMQAKPAKTVTNSRLPQITNADGKAVLVGDELTYTIEAINTTGETADIVITDKVPVGTELVSEEGGVRSGDTITWTVNDVAAGASTAVSFRVRVTEAALASTVANVENQATVQIGNNPSYTTNTTSNPPQGKLALGADANGKVQVDDELTYEVRYANDGTAPATITITDTVPAGTAYVADSATYHNNTNVFSRSRNTDGRDVLTWTLTNVQPGTSGAVSFRVAVTAETIADNNIANTAFINDVKTNTTVSQRKTGSIELRKTVTEGDATKAFTMILTEATGVLTGEFDITGASDATQGVVSGKVKFTNGTATITGVKHGTDVIISGLPLNAAIAVREEEAAGWTPTYEKRVTMTRESVEDADVLKISNSYKVTPVKFQLSGVKNFVGAGWPANASVNFQAQACSYDPTTGAVTLNSNRTLYAVATRDAASASFQFAESTIQAATGEQPRYYLVSEYVTDANRIADVDYDQTAYLMKLEVKDDGNGKLTAVTSYKKGTTATTDWKNIAEVHFNWQTNKVIDSNLQDTETTAIEFTNIHYQPTTLTISGNKTLSGRSMVDGEFVFELVDADGKVVSTTLKVNGDNKYTGTFTFNSITYTLEDVGTHTYTVREAQGTLGGVGYDTTNHTVTVTVSKNAENDQLVAVADKTASDLTFTNTYTSTNTTHAYYAPVANKTLKSRTVHGTDSGRNMIAGEFRFEVVELDPTRGYAPIQVDGADKVVSRGTNVAATAGTADANGWHEATGAIQFTPIDFSKDNHVVAGTSHYHYYLIREVSGSDGSITYTDAKKYLRVTVNENGNGVLAVTTAEYFTAADFTSSPVLTATVNLSTGEVTYDSDARATFTNYHGAGIAELSLNFNKKYVYADTNAWIPLRGAEFDFEVYAAADDSFNVAAGAQPITVGENAATNSDGVAAIHFVHTHITKADMGGEREKTFFYVVKEVVPDNAETMGLDVADPIGVSVTVQDDGYGNLTVKETTYYKQNAQSAWEVQSAADKNLFVNTYNPASVTVRIPINKLLVGKDLAGETFQFKLTGGMLPAEGVTATTNADGLAHFEVEFKAKDMAQADRDSATGYWNKTFEFEVSETDAITGKSDKGTYTKDATVYTVKVIVTEDGSGQLKAASYVGANRLEVLNFTNTYTPDAVTLDVDTVVNTTKTVVYPNGEPVRGYSLSGFTFAVKDAIGTTLSTGTSDADGKVDFAPALSFTEARDYYFWIVEGSSSADGITNDTKQWELHVVVEYDTKLGELKVARQHIHGAAVDSNNVAQVQFVNTYEPKLEGALTIEIEKELTGRDLHAGEFHFQLVEKLDTNQEVIRAEVTNGTPANGKAPVTFHMHYTYADIGDHSYKIVEVKDGKHGVEYSDEAITLKVTVSDNKAGKLVAEIKDQSADVTITNKYTPDPVKLDIDTVLTDGATKTLCYPNGERATGYDLSKFTFAVLDKNGTDTGVVGTTEADGRVSFSPELVFTEAGEYLFAIKENAVADSKVSIDQRVWTLKVVVTYDAATGLLHIAETKLVEGDQPDNSSAVTGIEFQNKYAPDVATLTLGAEKKLNGREMKSGEFSFRLLKKNAQGAYELVEEVKNAAPVNGKAAVTFRALNYSYDDIGVHNYKIVEVAGTLGGVTYDTTEYEVEVVVTADYEAGKIVAVAEYSDDAIFVNTYRAADVEVPITVYKELTGRTLKSGEFKFLLKEKVESGSKWRYVAVGEAVSNGSPANGKAPVVFNVTYTPDDIGVHEYIVVEEDNAVGGVTYDTKEIAVKVTVTDDGKGQLKAEVVMAENATFTNTYKANAVDVTLKATKELTGRDMKAGEFTFQVYDSTDVLVATGKNDAAGAVIFDTITFEKAGTYTLRVVEADLGDKEITYDDASYKVVVAVSDDGKGQLQAKVTYPDGAATFINNWEQPEVAPNTGDNFNAPLMVGTLGCSVAAIALLFFFGKKKKEETAE